MFTQFFGNYLLRRQLVTPQQLSEALTIQKNTRLRLGVLAINAGLLTAEQVEKAHIEQQRTDKRIGDVMVEMNFLTREQVEELFKTQPAGHLLLGQALVDKGYMTNAGFESAINSYKAENSISDSDISNADEALAMKLISNFYKFDADIRSDYIRSYISMLFKNLIRFIGYDFAPLESVNSENIIRNVVMQDISGGMNMSTMIYGDDSVMVELASRFSGEALDDYDEYTQACVSEFLNLHNGLFAVNISNDKGVELQFEPQCCYETFDMVGLSRACVIPVNYSFGTVNFVIQL